jgi:hypothetical protein
MFADAKPFSMHHWKQNDLNEFLRKSRNWFNMSLIISTGFYSLTA